MSFPLLPNTPLYADPNIVTYLPLKTDSVGVVGSLVGSDSNMTYSSGAAVFNGINSYISFGLSPEMNFTGDYTIQFLSTPLSSAEPYPGVFNKLIGLLIVNDGTNNNAWSYGNGQGGGFSRTITGADSTVTYGTEQLITVKRVGTDVSLFKNGVLLGTVAAEFVYPSGQCEAGRSPGRYYTGRLREILAFSRGLSNQEILDYATNNYPKFASTIKLQAVRRASNY